MKEYYDAIVVGSGASGSTIARELSRAGRSVLLVERGGRVERVGTTLAMARMAKNYGMTFSREKNSVVFGQTYGGASNLTAGCAMPPTADMFASAGIDLTREAQDAKKEMHINVMPDELVGKANFRLLEASHDLGFNWRKLEKFIDPEKCEIHCGDCMLGCKRGAKWTARIFGDEAARNGADILLNTRVDKLIVENNTVIGIEAKSKGKRITAYGKTVVLSGGLSDAQLLRKEGIGNAGRGLACDWLQFVGGIIPGMGTAGVSPMSVGTDEHYDADGFILTQAFPTFSQFALGTVSKGPSYMAKIPRFSQYTGVMVKIRDEIAGEMFTDSGFSKPITRQDRLRLNKGIDIIKKILKKAGADEKSFVVMDPVGAHPCASCRIGDVVDENLQTEISNLYCCDASVLPNSLGKPLVWVLVSLSKRLAGHLDSRLMKI